MRTNKVLVGRVLPAFAVLLGLLGVSASAQRGVDRHPDAAQRPEATSPGQHTAGVIGRVGIERYPVGCSSSQGNPTDANPWTNQAGSSRCSIATREDNVDGLMILVGWKTLQPDAYDEPLSSYYIDNAIYSLAHPERQSIHLAVLAGTHSPDWLINPPAGPGVTFSNKFGTGVCNPSTGGPSAAGPGTIWNVFSISGRLTPMPNPFGSNSCLFTALDNLVKKLGQSGDYNTPSQSPHPQPLAPYDNLYYDSAPGTAGFVHTSSPTPTMNKVIGHVSVLGPHALDGESVLCPDEPDCQNLIDNPANTHNVNLWTALQPDDFSMEAAIEAAQKQTIEIYATRFPNTYWTVDVVERQMPFFSPDGKGCRVSSNQYPPAGPNDASDCFGKLRTNLIQYIQDLHPSRGGVQNNSLGAGADQLLTHPVWRQTALAAQSPPMNPVTLFVGLQVGMPNGFYSARDTSFEQFRDDDQGAVNLAKQMVAGYTNVNFIEFYDVDISSSFTLAMMDGSPSAGSLHVDKSPSAINDDPDGINSGGFMSVPLTDAHLSLRVPTGPDFTLGFGSPTITGQAGTKAVITVDINRTGTFTGNVTVTPPPPVGGIKAKPADPMTTTGNSVAFKMKIGAAVTPGSYQLTFTGQDDSGIARTATITLNVQ